MIIKRAGGYFLFCSFDQRIFMRFVSINESRNDANFIFTSHVDSKLLFYFQNDMFTKRKTNYEYRLKKKRFDYVVSNVMNNHSSSNIP